MADSKISALSASSTPLAGTEVLPVVQSGATKKVSVSDLTAGRTIGMSGANVGITTPALVNINIPATSTTFGAIAQSQAVLHNPTTVGTHSQIAFGYTNGSSIANAAAAIAFKSTDASLWGKGDLVFGTRGSTSDVAPSIQLTVSQTNDVIANLGNFKVGTAAKGVNFTANTPAAGMTSQLLNWYEEGTFTPVVYGTTSAGTGTYSIQNGYYTRIGNTVTFTLYLEWSAHTGTGNMRIKDLPFTPSSSGLKGFSSFNIWSSVLARSSGEALQAISEGGQKFIALSSTNLTTGAATSLALDTAATICITGTYYV